MITIIDVGMGNIQSVRNAFDHLGQKTVVVSEAEQVARADKLVLPGVGSFRHASAKLDARLRDALSEATGARGRPLLGICLGMQLLATHGTEHGESRGLGFIPGTVRKIDAKSDPPLRLPHVGWNSVEQVRPCVLFEDLRPNEDFYFVHSYHFEAEHESDVVAITQYGGAITAAVARDNIFGMQFHPEKSRPAGLALLEAFSRV